MDDPIPWRRCRCGVVGPGVVISGLLGASLGTWIGPPAIPILPGAMAAGRPGAMMGAVVEPILAATGGAFVAVTCYLVAKGLCMPMCGTCGGMRI